MPSCFNSEFSEIEPGAVRLWISAGDQSVDADAAQGVFAGAIEDSIQQLDLIDYLDRRPLSAALPTLLRCASLLTVSGRLSLRCASPLAMAYGIQSAPNAVGQYLASLEAFGGVSAPPVMSAYTDRTLRLLLLTAGFSLIELYAEGLTLRATAVRAIDWRDVLTQHHQCSDETFLEGAYMAALMRNSDEVGRGYFLGLLESGQASRRDVLLNLYGSDERIRRMAHVHGL